MKHSLVFLAAGLFFAASCADLAKSEKTSDLSVSVFNEQSVHSGGFIVLKTGAGGKFLIAGFGGKNHGFFNVGDNYYSIIPVGFGEKTGSRKIRLEQSANISWISVNILKRRHKTVRIGGSKPLSGETIKTIHKEKAEINDALAVFSDELGFFSEKRFIYPLSEIYVTDEYGTKRQRPDSHYFHNGIDLRTGFDKEVLAVNRGKVVYAKQSFLNGKMVIIDHGKGIMSAYLHLSTIEVKKGFVTEKGQTIGLSGATGAGVRGPHLHFMVFVNGSPTDPFLFMETMNKIIKRARN